LQAHCQSAQAKAQTKALSKSLQVANRRQKIKKSFPSEIKIPQRTS
jgi:hypothetical protein